MSDYEETRGRHVADMFAALPEMTERIGWPRERLDQYRQEKLSAMLQTAKEKSPWHRRRLAPFPETLPLAGLSRLPAMTKADLMANFDEIVTDPRVTRSLVDEHLTSLKQDAYLLDSYHAVSSGGSSGVRGVFVYDWDSWLSANASALRWRLRAQALAGEGGLQSLKVGLVGALLASHISGALGQTFANPITDVHRFPATLPLDEIVKRLNEVQPTDLISYASILAQLAYQARQGRLQISPQWIVSSAEPLYPEIRAGIAEVWSSARISNFYAASEAGTVGCGCYFGEGIHLNEDLIVLEPVDDAGRPVPPGETSAKIYLTNLQNPLLPLIRYEISDRVTVLPEACACGSSFMRIADVQGRREEMFRYADADVTVHWYVFYPALEEHPAVIEYQIRQTARGADVDLRTSGPVDLAAIRQGLESGLREVGVPEPTVSVQIVENIARTSVGKLRRFVPLPAPPGDPVASKTPNAMQGEPV